MGKAITEEVLLRMEEEAIHEMLHYHEKTGKQKIKDTVKRAAGRYVAPKDLIFWPTAMIANCLTEWEMGGVLMNEKTFTNEKSFTDEKALSAVKAYFDRWIDAGMPIFYIDDTLAGVSLVDLYAATGEEKYKAGADKMAEYLFRLEREEADSNGSIPYRPSQKNGYVFADGVGMVSSFLVKYGAAFDHAHSVELGLLQMRNMFRFGMDEKTGLPYHGFRRGKNTSCNAQYDAECVTKYGIIGWGRAVGWLLMGLARSLRSLEKCLAEGKKGAIADVCRAGYEECGREYRQLLAAAAPYQKENGAFTWQLQAAEGPEDSSATAMIAYAACMGRPCGRAGAENENTDANAYRGTDVWEGTEELADRAAAYLAGCEKDGKIYHCLAECMGFAEYPQVYGAYPWSLGPGLGVLRKKGV